MFQSIWISVLFQILEILVSYTPPIPTFLRLVAAVLIPLQLIPQPPPSSDAHPITAMLATKCATDRVRSACEFVDFMIHCYASSLDYKSSFHVCLDADDFQLPRLFLIRCSSQP